MAFYDGGEADRTQGGSSMTAIDGVPFKIGDNFLPPKKVTLPLHYNPANPADVLFLEYDFSLEERVLAEAEAHKRSKLAFRVAETDRIGASIEQFSRGSRDQHVGSDVARSSADGHFKKSEEEPMEVDSEKSPIKNPKNNRSEEETQSQARVGVRPRQAYLGFDILTPTPSAQIVKPRRIESENGSKASFNLADFEKEEDPFENVELKTLNDMEELNKVLIGAQVSAESKINQAHGQPSKGVVVSAPSAATTAACTNETDTQPLPFAKYSSNSLQNVDYPDIDTISDRSSAVSIRTSDSRVRYTPYLKDRSCSPVATDLSQTPTPAGMPITSLPPTQSSQFPQMTPAFNVQTCNGNSQNALSGNAFHNNHSVTAVNSTNCCVSSSHYRYPPNGIISQPYKEEPTINPLRSARSTPDVREVESNQRYPSSHTPPPYPPARSPPKRASLSQEMSHPAGFTKGSRSSLTDRLSAGSPSQSISRLPDPYANLSREASRFVDTITDMGFRRAMVARQVEKLGQDGKKVVDRLCIIDRLTDKGYDSDEVETALYLLDYDEEKATFYLQLVNQFKELGFKKEKISEALLKCDLDENKALDWLTAT